MKMCNSSSGRSMQQWITLQLTVSIKQDIFKQKEMRAAPGSAHDHCKAEVLLSSAWGADASGQRQDNDLKKRENESECVWNGRCRI